MELEIGAYLQQNVVVIPQKEKPSIPMVSRVL